MVRLSMQEGLTWLMIGMVTAAYIAQRRGAVKKEDPHTVDLSTADEVDPTRWKHTGAQPAHYGTFDGNRKHLLDAAVLDLQSVLAF